MEKQEENNILKDSGGRREFESGAKRDMSSDKGLCKFLPPNALMALARHFEYGAKKYSDVNAAPNKQNWMLGFPLSTMLDSGIRHALKALDGRDDENHVIAAMWNFACYYELKVMIDRGELPKELDDLPHRPAEQCKDYYMFEDLLKVKNPSDIKIKKQLLEDYFCSITCAKLIEIAPKEFTSDATNHVGDEDDYCTEFDEWLENLEDNELIEKLFDKYKQDFAGKIAEQAAKISS